MSLNASPTNDSVHALKQADIASKAAPKTACTKALMPSNAVVGTAIGTSNSAGARLGDNLPRVVVTGVACGLPGQAKVFEDDNLARLLAGQGCLEKLSDGSISALVEKNVVQVSRVPHFFLLSWGWPFCEIIFSFFVDICEGIYWVLRGRIRSVNKSGILFYNTENNGSTYPILSLSPISIFSPIFPIFPFLYALPLGAAPARWSASHEDSHNEAEPDDQNRCQVRPLEHGALRGLAQHRGNDGQGCQGAITEAKYKRGFDLHRDQG